jgi:hypothetical protein
MIQVKTVNFEPVFRNCLTWRTYGDLVDISQMTFNSQPIIGEVNHR